jgi:hypothetical protein
MTLVLVLVLLTSELPDPGKPGTISLAGMLGGFAGALLAIVRRRPSQVAGDMARVGMVIGVGAGLAGWLIVLAIDRL